jgi:uncharacterized protein (UPF0276 family)
MNTRLDIGLGLRAQHYSHILESRPSTSWFEAISENYLGIESGGGGRPLETLKKIRAEYPLVLHGVSMSIGSADPLNFNYLKNLRELIGQIEPEWISDHLCWTGVNGENLHDLLPLPYTEEALEHICGRVGQVQDFLGRNLVLENVSAYLSFRHSEMTEWEFISDLTRKTGCGILLDVNNIYVSAVNQGFDPNVFLASLPKKAVKQMHLAGHSQGKNCLIDTHDGPVCNEVWQLYETAIKLFPAVPTLIEWDDKIPEFSRLEQEAENAKKIWVGAL